MADKTPPADDDSVAMPPVEVRADVVTLTYYVDHQNKQIVYLSPGRLPYYEEMLIPKGYTVLRREKEIPADFKRYFEHKGDPLPLNELVETHWHLVKPGQFPDKLPITGGGPSASPGENRRKLQRRIREAAIVAVGNGTLPARPAAPPYGIRPLDFIPWLADRFRTEGIDWMKSYIAYFKKVLEKEAGGAASGHPAAGTEAAEAADLCAGAESVEDDESREDYIFRKRGQVWELRFEGGDRYHLPGRKGMQYIVYLLEHPEESIDVFDLQQIIDPAPAVTQEEKNAAAEVGEGRRSPADCSESIDDKTVRETKERIRRLKEMIEEKRSYGGDARQEKTELEQLAEYLSANLNRTGKRRKVDPVMEKVRKAVSNAIDVAIKDIAKQDDTAARHFEVFIATGRTIIYKPGQPISWTTT